MRAGDLSFETIARILYNEAGVEATAETLRGWAQTLGIGPRAKAEAS
jgi:hypothetical protein